MAISAPALLRLPPIAAPEAPDARWLLQALLFSALLCLVGNLVPIAIGLLIVVPVLLIWMWTSPVRGLYVLLAGGALIEVFPLHFKDSFTDRIPLFTNLNNSAGLQGFPITPAEILMLAVAIATIARAVGERKLRWPDGRIVTAYVIYLVVVLGAEVHGLLAGGDLKTSLWEMRPQVYGFVLFMLTTALVEDRRQLLRLGAIFLLAVVAKALIGDYRYFITLAGHVGAQEEVLAHEDSYFLAMFLVAALCAVIWMRLKRNLVLLVAVVSSLALLAMLANTRRAGVYALAGGIVVLILLAYRFEPELRKRVVLASLVLLIAGAGFVGYAWNKEYGMQAQLVRPVRSLIDPSQRDFQSDHYRTAENANLQLTFQSSPIIGVGFGSPYLMAYPQADISQIYPLWNVIPHNTLMWVGMRMGVIGFAAFWALVGMAILQGLQQLGTRRDPLLRAVAAFAIAAIVGELLVGYGDLQLESYRNLIFLGVVIGVLNRMPQLADA